MCLSRCRAHYDTSQSEGKGRMYHLYDLPTRRRKGQCPALGNKEFGRSLTLYLSRGLILLLMEVASGDDAASFRAVVPQ